MGSNASRSIADSMESIDGVETTDDVLKWIQTARYWKDSLRNKTSRANLLRLSTILTGNKMRKTQALLAQDVIGAIDKLNKSRSTLSVKKSISNETANT